MRTTIHILLILFTGVALGLVVRSFRTANERPQPSVEDVIYTSDVAPGDAIADDVRVENDQPSRPPEDEAWLSRFELTERSGETINSEDLLGTPYVVSFFFSTCPSICVTQNQKIQELQKEFEGQDVRFVAISVDPETDSPKVLQEYAARFGADPEQWLFLTGDLDYIRKVGSMVFRLPVNKQFHSERFVLIDDKGEIQGFYNWPDEKQFDQLKIDIRELANSVSTAKSS